MTLDETALNVVVGQEDVQLTAEFDPDIAAKQPAPAVTFESSDDSVVKAQQNADEPWKADLTFLKAGSATITAKLGDYKAQCTVTVESAESATRWEFFKYGFEDWASRPISAISKSGTVSIEDGVAVMTPGTGVSDISLHRNSGNQRTGIHSFQFDFRFEEDDANITDNANNVWFRAYYNSSCEVKVSITQDSVGVYK